MAKDQSKRWTTEARERQAEAIKTWTPWATRTRRARMLTHEALTHALDKLGLSPHDDAEPTST